jgi:hypothetical protein
LNTIAPSGNAIAIFGNTIAIFENNIAISGNAVAIIESQDLVDLANYQFPIIFDKQESSKEFLICP